MTAPLQTSDLYPRELENWWLTQLHRFHPGRDQEASLRKMEKAVARLGDLFTIERDHPAGRAYDSDEAVLAYGLFYFPQTFARTVLVMEELLHFRGWRPADPASVRILDIGCGSGASVAGLLHALAPTTSVQRAEVHGVDPSGLNLDAARSLTREWEPPGPASWKFQFHHRTLQPAAAGPLALPRGPWDLIVFSFSLNELALRCDAETLGAWLLRILAGLKPGGLAVILDPALQETSVRLMSLRDWLLEASHLHLWGPCLHARPCPLLAGGRHWCHEVRRWTPPASLEFLNRHLHRDIRHLKFSFLALGRNPAPEIAADDLTFRTISPVTRSAGKFSLQGCAADGQIHTYEWLQRYLDKSQKDFLRSTWERGDLGSAQESTRTGAGIRIHPPPRASRLHPPDTPQ